VEDKKKLVAVAGLRTADPTTLQVLTQDVLRTPLVRIEPATLADLLALSEIGGDPLPGAMVKELDRFQRQMFRELADLPDGPPLAEFMGEVGKLPADTVPACLRKAVADLVEDRKSADAIEAIQAFLAGVEGVDPTPVQLPTREDDPDATSAPVEKVAAKKKTSTRKRATPKSQVDPRRGEWIEGDVLDRLNNYHNGLKESVMVAGSRHRSPWDDVSVKEVMAVLRRLKREGRVRYSAGRWLINK